jgi:DNA-binding CsgD family transcriptional regulator
MNPVIVRNTEAVVSEKDIQIVKYLSEGLKAAQISEIIGGSNRTVEFRVGRLKGLYNAKTIAHLCCIFKDLGII